GGDVSLRAEGADLVGVARGEAERGGGDFEEVFAAVLAGGDGAGGLGFGEFVEVEVADEHGFLVGVGLGGDAVAGEGEVGGGEHGGLAVLHVHVFDVGQVADVAGEGHVNLVFDGAGGAADAHAQVALAVVGAEGNEDDLGAGVGETAGGLGELGVVADEHADAGGGGLDDAQVGAAGDAPPATFVGGDVELGLLGGAAVGQIDGADVVQLLADAGGVAAADDGDAVFDGEFGEEGDEPGREFGEFAHALLRRLG